MPAPQLAARMTKAPVAALTALFWTAVPAVALAAGEEDLTFGPSWKQIFGWGLLGLGACAVVYAVARWIYGICLDANWPVDFTLGLIISGVLLAWVAIGLGVYLFLYNWPQPWTKIVGYSVLGGFVLVLLIALFGRNRQSA